VEKGRGERPFSCFFVWIMVSFWFMFISLFVFISYLCIVFHRLQDVTSHYDLYPEGIMLVV